MTKSRSPAPQGGVTLIEIMIVLAILSLMMFALVGSGMLATNGTRLRQDAVKVLAALRSARHLSVSTGRQHRAVFDLEEQQYQIEVCDRLVRMTPSEEEKEVDRDALQELMEKPVSSDFKRELLEAESPEKALEVSAALAKVSIGTARCTLTTRGSGHADSQKVQFAIRNKERGIHIERIHVQHLSEPVTEGQVGVNFFPIGSAEKALVRLENQEGDAYTVLVHGMSGRVEIRAGEVDAEDHILRDGEGNEVEGREAE